MPAPANDNFASATALSTTLPSTLTGQTTVDATYEATEPLSHGGNEHRGVWYTFTPTSTGRYKFAVNASDTVVWTDGRRPCITVFSGSAIGSLTELRKMRNGGTTMGLLDGDRLIVEVDLTSGVTYRIRVGWAWFTGENANASSFNFEIVVSSVTNTPTPGNDNIANATNLGTDPADGNYAGTLIGATDDASPFNYDTPTVWAKFVSGAAGAQEMHIVSPNEDDLRPYFELYKVTGTNPPASFADLTFIGDTTLDVANDYIGDYTPTLDASSTYYLLIYSNDYNGATDTYEIVFGPYTPATPPGNNNRASVVALGAYDLAKSHFANYASFPRARSIDGTTVLATAEGSDPAIAGFAATRNVWYRFSAYDAANYKVWVESAVDCVLAVYEVGAGGSIGTFVDDDDDSGTGNWPELTFAANPAKTYWLLIDSKTEGTFTLKFQEVVIGTPPANDTFATATVISSIPYSAAGTTVGANAEPGEKDSETLGVGPTDTVWYKYIATADRQLEVYARNLSANNDGYVVIDTWKGTTLANLVRYPTPLNLNKGFFSVGDTEQQIQNNKLIVNVVNGETYYFRVQTESGGSEDFTIYVDEQVVYVDIQTISYEEMHGTLLDDAIIPLTLTITAIEDGPDVFIDTATIVIDIQVSSAEFVAKEYLDTGTVRVTISIDSHDCHTLFDSESIVANIYRAYEARAYSRWLGTTAYRRFEVIFGDGFEEC